MRGDAAPNYQSEGLTRLRTINSGDVVAESSIKNIFSLLSAAVSKIALMSTSIDTQASGMPLQLILPSVYCLTRREDLPVNIGYIVYPGFQALDVFGPLDPLNMLSMEVPLKLSIIGPTLEPVSTKAPLVAPTVSPDFGQSIVPTHTFASPPKDLDVLIVPGGAGSAYPLELQQAQIDFVKEQYPKLKYLISVCTGASLLARAGVLNGKRATTTKAGWAWTTSTGPNVNWVPKARCSSHS